MSPIIAAGRTAKKALFTSLVAERFLSVSSKDAPYFLVGLNNNIEIQANRCVPLKEWFQKHPLMEKIPGGRLIIVDPGRPYQFNDASGNRRLLWTAAIHADVCMKRGISLDGAFNDGNVGVVPDICVLCFKNVNAEKNTTTSSGFDKVADFLEQVVAEEHGATLSELPAEWDSLVQGLRTPNISADWVLHHSAFFTDEEIATLFIDLHRMLRHEMRLRGHENEALNIFAKLEKVYPDQLCQNICQMHFLLMHLLGGHTKKRSTRAMSASATLASQSVATTPTSHAAATPSQPSSAAAPSQPSSAASTPPLPPSAATPTSSPMPHAGLIPPHPIPHPKGSVVVDVNRIAVVHSIEMQLLNNVIKTSRNAVPSRLLHSYMRVEVIRLLRYLLSCYAEVTLDAYRDEKLLHMVELHRRKPIPSIYKI